MVFSLLGLFPTHLLASREARSQQSVPRTFWILTHSRKEMLFQNAIWVLLVFKGEICAKLRQRSGSRACGEPWKRRSCLAHTRLAGFQAEQGGGGIAENQSLHLQSLLPRAEVAIYGLCCKQVCNGHVWSGGHGCTWKEPIPLKSQAHLARIS